MGLSKFCTVCEAPFVRCLKTGCTFQVHKGSFFLSDAYYCVACGAVSFFGIPSKQGTNSPEDGEPDFYMPEDTVISENTIGTYRYFCVSHGVPQSMSKNMYYFAVRWYSEWYNKYGRAIPVREETE